VNKKLKKNFFNKFTSEIINLHGREDVMCLKTIHKLYQLQLELSPEHIQFQNYDQISLPAFSKHDLIFFTYNNNIYYNNYYTNYKDFNNIDYALLSADLDSCDWNSIYCTAEANTQLEILQRKVKILDDTAVPLKRKMWSIKPLHRRNEITTYIPTFKKQ